MKIIVTGCAGFIGFHTCLKLLRKNNYKIYGIDNLDNYYSQKLKKDRLEILLKNKKFKFYKININNFNKLKDNFLYNQYDYVIHLAAQPGVRYSLDYPRKYIQNNLLGFYNIIELSNKIKVKHFVYASSSSVYGESKNSENKENDNSDKPLSIYSATKKSNEIISYAFSNIYNLKTTGLRLFTVYGTYYRPDMFLSLLADAIKNNKIINVYNHGNYLRDFTYVEDVTYCISKIIMIKKFPRIPAYIFNIGNSRSVELNKIISFFENYYSKKAIKKYKKNQVVEVSRTKSKMTNLRKIIKIKQFTKINHGLIKFLKWHDEYYKVNTNK